jgi:hypothetical protein
MQGHRIAVLHARAAFVARGELVFLPSVGTGEPTVKAGAELRGNSA